MRIALYHNAPSGGAKRAIYEWTRRLAKDHAIDVYTLSTAEQEFCDIRPYAGRHSISDFSLNKAFNSPFGRLNQLQRRRDLDELTELNKQIAKTIDDGRYDVVFAHTCRFTVIPTLLQFLTTPSVYYLHEPFGNNFTRHFSRPYMAQNQVRTTLDRYDPFIKAYGQKLSALQRESVKQTELLLANSRYTQRYMREMFDVDAPVSHLGVDHESFDRIEGTRKEPFVVSVGEMSPRKGFDFIVESLGRIPDNIRPPFKIACNRIEQPELMYIKGLAEQFKVDLEVRSNLDTADLSHLYNQAGLCVYAPVKEPFGLVPLEAMACGTAVVGVNEGGVKESVIHEHTGLLVDRDPQQFASAVQQLLSNPTLASDYGCNGRNYIMGNWTWDRATAELEGYLTSVTARSAAIE